MNDTRRLDDQLQQLHLHYIRSNYQEQANKAAEQIPMCAIWRN
jgi:hypothetical protein